MILFNYCIIIRELLHHHFPTTLFIQRNSRSEYFWRIVALIALKILPFITLALKILTTLETLCIVPATSCGLRDWLVLSGAASQALQFSSGSPYKQFRKIMFYYVVSFHLLIVILLLFYFR